MSYFGLTRTAPSGDFYWKHVRAWYSPNPNPQNDNEEKVKDPFVWSEHIENQYASGNSDPELSTNVPSYLGYDGRFVIVRLAPPTQQDLEEDYTCIGTFGILTQYSLYHRWLKLIPAEVADDSESDSASGDEKKKLRTDPDTRAFCLDTTVVDINKLPPAACRFRVYKAEEGHTYAFRCIVGVTAPNNAPLYVYPNGFLQAVAPAQQAGFKMSPVKAPTYTNGVIEFAFVHEVGSGPALPAVVNTTTGAMTSGFTYLISSAYGAAPATGYDFNWRQLRWTSSTGVDVASGIDTASQTWIFIPIKSKPTNTIYSYKIRIANGNLTDGFLKCTTRGITGDEFELIPHSEIFGCFTIRSVAHGTTLKTYLIASSSTNSVSWNVASAPASTLYAWQFRPAANNLLTSETATVEMGEEKSDSLTAPQPVAAPWSARLRLLAVIAQVGAVVAICAFALYHL